MSVLCAEWSAFLNQSHTVGPATPVNTRMGGRSCALVVLGLGLLARPALAQPTYTPSTLAPLVPLGEYAGVVLQSFGNQTVGDTGVQRCGGPWEYGLFSPHPDPSRREAPFSQPAYASVQPYAFDFDGRPQVEALAYGALQVPATERVFTTLRGVALPVENRNILRLGFEGECTWAQAYPRSDGGYDWVLVELGGADWQPRRDGTELDSPAQCSPLTYSGPLAALQPDWTRQPVCMEGGKGGGLKRWSRVYMFSPVGAEEPEGSGYTAA